MGLSTIYLSMKVSFSPDIIFFGWLGLKHQLTNLLIPLNFLLAGLQGQETQQDPEDDHRATEAGHQAAGWEQLHGLTTWPSAGHGLCQPECTRRGQDKRVTLCSHGETCVRQGENLFQGASVCFGWSGWAVEALDLELRGCGVQSHFIECSFLCLPSQDGGLSA